MGEIFLVEYEGQEAILKIIRLKNPTERKKYWEREAQIIHRQSKSPFRSLQYFDAFKSSENEYCLLMEHIIGQNMEEWMINKRNEWQTRMPNEAQINEIIKTILLPLCGHLSYVHQLGIIHRDLTPRNIMIESSDNTICPVIIDWGVAKELPPKKMFNPPKPFFTSQHPSYATRIRSVGNPPEILEGFKPVAASDIYSYGAVMYYLLSGGKYCSLSELIKSNYSLNITQSNSNTPPELANLLLSMTKFEPADRITNFALVYEELQKYLDNNGQKSLSLPATFIENIQMEWITKIPQLVTFLEEINTLHPQGPSDPSMERFLILWLKIFRICTVLKNSPDLSPDQLSIVQDLQEKFTQEAKPKLVEFAKYTKKKPLGELISYFRERIQQYTDEAEQFIVLNPLKSYEIYEDELLFINLHRFAFNPEISRLAKKETMQKIQLIKKAVEIDPEDATAWKELGNTYFNQKYYSEAELCFKKVDDLDLEEDLDELDDSEGLYHSNDDNDILDFEIDVIAKIKTTGEGDDKFEICPFCQESKVNVLRHLVKCKRCPPEIIKAYNVWKKQKLKPRTERQSLTLRRRNKFLNEVLEQINFKSIHLNPIIPRIFRHLLVQCVEEFEFDIDPLPFNDYFEFYKETNRLIPTLPKKIITEDCYSKVFFIGDTHGAIQESFLLIEYFLQIYHQDSKVKFIFVGDYVNRNPYDLENLTLITAFRLLFPDNVVMLRGNHEDRLINTHYGFIDNLTRSFLEKGVVLYDEIIKFFTHLPIVHISQMYYSKGKPARVMTVHGGIPINLDDFLNPLDLQEVEQQLICEVEESKDMDVLTTTMLWADPDETIQGVVTGEHLHGRIKFGSLVFDAFMKKNNLDLLVRGHQKWKEGFKTFFGGRLYSLFSTSTYDGVPKFHPKILELEYGQPPKIIPVEKESLIME